MPVESKDQLISNIRENLSKTRERAEKNLDWLAKHMHPYFFITMKEETSALSTLASELQSLQVNKQLVLADRENVLIVVRQDRPGSLYDTLSTLQERDLLHGDHPYFLGTFYVRARQSADLTPDGQQFAALRAELFNSQILSTKSFTYQGFVTRKIMCGEDASLINAFLSFCHTNLAHSNPDVNETETVAKASWSHPETALKPARLFRTRFDPELQDRESVYLEALEDVMKAVKGCNTGHRHQDELHKTVFQCCLAFIKHT